jgi:Fe-S-cluster containining protein
MPPAPPATACNPDQTQAFLDSLPEIGPGQSFRFACHPGVPCFGACCSDLALMLTPFDVLRLRRALGEDSRAFISGRADIAVAPDTGLPQLRLRMLDAPGAPCPFLRAQGCAVYADRPGACRTYPLGRATRPDPAGAPGAVRERFFLVQEPHCRGFEQPTEWTTETWLSDQGLPAYNAANDQVMALMARIKDSGRPAQPKHANMALLALYQQDAFARFLADMKVLDRLDLADERRAAVLAHEEARLTFALEWLEMLFFGPTPTLRPKP